MVFLICGTKLFIEIFANLKRFYRQENTITPSPFCDVDAQAPIINTFYHTTGI